VSSGMEGDGEKDPPTSRPTPPGQSGSPRGGHGAETGRGGSEPPPLFLSPTRPSRPIGDAGAAPAAEPTALRPGKMKTSSVRWPRLLVSALVVVLVCLWLFQAVVAWAASLALFHPWLSPILYATVALLVAMVAWQVWKDVRRYRRLRRADSLRERLDEARDDLAYQLLDNKYQLKQDFKELVCQFLNDGVITQTLHDDVVKMPDGRPDVSSSASWVAGAGNLLLRDMDERVKHQIEYEARLIGLSTALSPSGPLDSFIVLWRNTRLVLRIAEVYNVRPGKYGGYRLFWRVAVNAVAAGLSDEAAQMLYTAYGPGIVELVSGGFKAAFDLLMKCGLALAPYEPYSAGALWAVGGAGKGISGAASKVAAQVSGPMLQGILTGILAIRIGLAAQAECRLLTMTKQERKEECANIISTFIMVFPVRGMGRSQPGDEEAVPAPA
jgi:uncharacterized membrane protein YcjF (UPF0283 family)